jgi:hypothetical protein
MLDKRLPERTPGPAMLPPDPDDEFTVPAALYCDAIRFLREAVEAPPQQGNESYDCYLRASLFSAFAALEAQLNQAAYAHAKSHAAVLQGFTLDVLEERESVLDEKGNIIRKVKYYPFESRFSFLVSFLSGKEFDRSGSLWRGLRAAKALRDSWMHPKAPQNNDSLTIPAIRAALMSVRDALVKLSEMMGVAPPLWLLANDVP